MMSPPTVWEAEGRPVDAAAELPIASVWVAAVHCLAEVVEAGILRAAAVGPKVAAALQRDMVVVAG